MTNFPMMPYHAAAISEWLGMSAYPSDARVVKIADANQAGAVRYRFRGQR